MIPASVIVLAAGAGTRMKSKTPKVLHEMCGRSLLGHVLHAARATNPARLAVVVRHERDLVAAHALEVDPEVIIADQDEVPGTGRAVWCALEALGEIDGPVLVTAADTPLLTEQIYADLFAAHEGNAVTILTARVDDATGYGRICRDEKGTPCAIVEHKDATEEQRKITEINTSIYVFDAKVLREGLAGVDTDNAQGEMYLTDVIEYAYSSGLPVGSREAPALSVEGVNDKVQLARLAGEMNRRLLEDAMRAGATIVDPAATWTEVGVSFAPDCLILPGSYLAGTTSIAAGATVGPFVRLTDCEVEAGAEIAFADLAYETITAPENTPR